MKKNGTENKMIDIYEANLEDYFKYLLERVNKFLNDDSEYGKKLKRQFRINKKESGKK